MHTRFFYDSTQGIIGFFALGYLVLFLWDPSIFCEIRTSEAEIGLSLIVSVSFYLFAGSIFKYIIYRKKKKEICDFHSKLVFNNMLFAIFLTATYLFMRTLEIESMLHAWSKSFKAILIIVLFLFITLSYTGREIEKEHKNEKKYTFKRNK